MNFDTLDHGLQALIRQVGAFELAQFAQFSQAQIEYKGKNNLVTFVDRTAEDMLVAGCRDLLPGAAFVNEETGPREGDAQSDFTFVIDPVDGTTNFAHGVPIFSISLALLQAGQPVLGYVYHVPFGELFHARAGQGAFVNDTPIRVSQAPALERALLATGFPYTDFGHMQPYMRLMADFLQQCHGLRRMGSAAIDLAYVAAGRFDAFYEHGLNPWDVAAGVLLVREAGGTCTTFTGSQDCIFNPQIIASNTHIHNQMQQVIATHMADHLVG